ncbi:group II intron reverse transcriptase/maturase [Sediminitomix flava]|uniref:Group II intron reverse transcriptase/maturase n=1 Tax=Sediminitomix flava TaxID=379075 RepID=A0A315YX94_SEDFL|nr:group II intron reverse transcriptase/maturase [Sediminitomix flava]PWJ32681.1 group II intron reverse transcriptase/maturase [Sediminitomix flava]
MINELLTKENMRMAYHQVVRNKGAGGIDKMQVHQLLAHLQDTWETTKSKLENGKFCPQPIKGVEIPKTNGKTRLLGIPTVEDRLIQQAMCQVLSPIFEPEFQEHSYGFRPNKNAQQAISQALSYINEGYQDIIDIDLKSFFDEVEHALVLELVYAKVKCPKLLLLLKRYLRAPILVNGKLCQRRKGVPQGGPLSLLLSNILLNELDKELEKRGHKYIRYADDFSIYLKSKQSAKRTGNSIYLFLKNKLKLPINKEKSGIRRPFNFKALGYGFVPTYKKGAKGKYQLVVDTKAWNRVKQSLKEVSRKTIPMSFDERIKRLKSIQRGWVNYFKLANIKGKLKKVDEWLRNRLRYCIWHHWKKPERKRKNLIRLGIEKGQAYAWSRTRMGGWAVACSPILGTTITIQRLEKRGYESMLNLYKRSTEN